MGRQRRQWALPHPRQAPVVSRPPRHRALHRRRHPAQAPAARMVAARMVAAVAATRELVKSGPLDRPRSWQPLRACWASWAGTSATSVDSRGEGRDPSHLHHRSAIRSPGCISTPTLPRQGARRPGQLDRSSPRGARALPRDGVVRDDPVSSTALHWSVDHTAWRHDRPVAQLKRRPAIRVLKQSPKPRSLPLASTWTEVAQPFSSTTLIEDSGEGLQH
jgi:hypothetical protein